MKVVVANPPWPGEGYGTRSNIRWPHRRGDKVLTYPVYLAYTVSVLKKDGFQTKGIDAVDKEWGISEFVEQIKEMKPDAILLEVSTPSINFDFETAHKLKEAMPNLFIVLCGPHVSYFHQSVIDNYRFVNACIRGEFDYAMRDICRALRDKRDLKSVDGITYRKGSKTIVNKEREKIANLDDLPFPDREDFKLDSYQQAFFHGDRYALVISSRGCPFRCTFCLWPNSLFGHAFRARSAKNVVDEIEYLIKEHNIDGVYFDDDTFAINKKRVHDICDEIKKRGLKFYWCCMGRVDTIDEEMLKDMKSAGCYEIFYGFESGSDKILNSVNKGINKEQMRKAVKITQQAGLVASGSFIFGLPGDSHKTVKQTLDFAKSLGADYVQFVLAAPFPGSKMYEEAMEKGLIKINSWSDFDGSCGPIMKTENLSREELGGIIRKAYISYYTAPRVVWSNLKKIRGFDDMKRIFRGARSVLSRIVYYKK